MALFKQAVSKAKGAWRYAGKKKEKYYAWKRAEDIKFSRRMGIKISDKATDYQVNQAVTKAMKRYSEQRSRKSAAFRDVVVGNFGAYERARPTLPKPRKKKARKKPMRTKMPYDYQVINY